MRLTDYASDRYSQFGEDGMIAHVFEKIGVEDKVCLEVGAADGKTCSNTANLWLAGWRAYLIEDDSDRFDELVRNVQSRSTCIPVHKYVEPNGPDCIDAILEEEDCVDYVSIDVDGNDWMLFEGLQKRARLISIEYNQSIPPHISLRQRTKGDGFGASALALCEIAHGKDYELVGLTKANLFFIPQEDIAEFADYERSLDVLFEYGALTYLATDYTGHGVFVGSEPPWGFQSGPYLRETIGAPVMVSSTDSDELVKAWESMYGRAIYIADDWFCNFADPSGGTSDAMVHLFQIRLPLLIVNVGYVPEPDAPWMAEIADRYHYTTRRSRDVVAFIRKDLIDRPI